MKQSILMSALIGSTLLSGMVAPAQAGTIGCAAVNGNLANKISGSIGCEISGTVGSGGFVIPGEGQDMVGGGNANFTVNKEKFFTASNWLFAGKSDDGLEDNFTPNDGSPANGIYRLDGALGTLLTGTTNVMLIFKGGSETSLVGYLLDNRVNPFQGSWKTPFTKPPFPFNGQATSKAVSHISVYYRTGPPVAVPTPALLPALIGLGFGVVRKKKQEAQEA